eukprot:GFUD01057739.1.p1 GENE.GFUD01057739.1~~GFUD01057739.1.p1  ORF type:complete len:517 (-),score=103.95 GFUD01057739.1:128-1678(-)
MATPITIPLRELMEKVQINDSDIGSGSSCSGSGNNSPTLGTSYFGRISPRSSTVKGSITSCQAPPSPTTIKRLLRIRKMSEMAKTPQSGNFTTIPTQLADVNPDWAKLIINQHRIKHFQPPLHQEAMVTKLTVDDCKKSSGDMSTTCRINVKVDTTADEVQYYFIAKLLPADDPCRVYVFEANVFEKEISIYFELLPFLKQSCLNNKLERLLSSHIPQCIYGSNNMDGAGVLVFECALEQGFLHPVNPQGLSLEQVLCVINFMAKFHAIGSALITKSHKSMKLRYPYLLSNVYSSPLMIEGAKKMFEIYDDFLKSVPDQRDLAEKFEKHCMGDDGAKEMFSCLRRQVDTPFNTIVHGEIWEKNMLFKDSEDEHFKSTLECVVLDWKNAKIASATKDIAFLLLSSTTNQLRKEFLDVILCKYYSTFCETLRILNPDLLKSNGLTFEDFYTDYKISTKGAFMQAVCVLVQEMQHIEHQLNFGADRKKSDFEIGETLRIYERRALNLMNDKVLNETHFV